VKKAEKFGKYCQNTLSLSMIEAGSLAVYRKRKESFMKSIAEKSRIISRTSN